MGAQGGENARKGGVSAYREQFRFPRLALRPAEAAQALGISERTLRKWMKDEGLPYFRVDGAVCIPTHPLHEWILDRTRSQHSIDDTVDEILGSF